MTDDLMSKHIKTKDIMVFDSIVSAEYYTKVEAFLIQNHLKHTTPRPYKGYMFKYITDKKLWGEFTERQINNFLENNNGSKLTMTCKRLWIFMGVNKKEFPNTTYTNVIDTIIHCDPSYLSVVKLVEFLKICNGMYRIGYPIITDLKYDHVYHGNLVLRDPTNDYLFTVEPEYHDIAWEIEFKINGLTIIE